MFVEAVSFTTQVPCFNVTADEFVPASTSSSSVPTSIAAGQATASATGGRKDVANGGLSGGAKAGIVVGCIFGAALVFASIFFAIRRKGGSGRDAEAMPALVEKNAKGNDGASVMSGKTAS
jgi:predicted phage tail protein